MNKGTAIVVVLALASLGGAWAMRPIEVPPPTYEDTGEEMFPEFTDPNGAARLSVKTWDKEGAKLARFEVQFKDGKWVIPSHNDYPADGTERMGKAAASFIGVKKDVVRGDDPKEHAEFGVEDPEDPDASDAGRGQRITIDDESGNSLVDIIVGKDVPDKEGFKYVRLPGQDRVYASKLTLDVSTKFVDWIEKDLLKFERDMVVKVVSDSYRVDEELKKVVDRKPLAFELLPTGEFESDGSPKKEWSLMEGVEADIPPGHELHQTPVKQIYGAASRVKIVGVRPRPNPLTNVALQAKGFFIAADGRKLFGNEGEVELTCIDGVIYKLYFGEITYDTEELLSAGGDAEGSAEKQENQQANRYMFVEVYYDPEQDRSSDYEPPEPKEGEEPMVLGEERAQMLQQRFSQWFYVIADSSFSQMHKTPDKFWREIKE